ncbi:hypothetical protein NP493_1386g00031 [Ridgeia piscesae]|uniref:Uncharacterized protein n=1 Tax=Ridgeia piscesae TaxID=27915 RepID=A0AAD9NE37_RIDPI|nr:hypothetical protein NP493_1386g00031 [Ridgeia piscesae]
MKTSDKTCTKCPDNCKKCAYVGTTLTCSECKTDFMMKTDKTCIACPTNCDTCTAEGKCDTCKTGFIVKSDNTVCLGQFCFVPLLPT